MKRIITTLFTLLSLTIVTNAQTVLADFEDGSGTVHGGWEGAAQTINNPATTGINTSAKVAEYTIPAGKSWANCAWVKFSTSFESNKLDSIQFMIKAPSTAQLWAKLESDATNSEHQPSAYITPIASSDWQLVTFKPEDLTAEGTAGIAYDKLAIFFDVNSNESSVWLYDNVVAFGNIGSTPAEPGAPTNLQVSNITQDSFTLTWDIPANCTETEISIKDLDANGNELWVATVGEGINTYTYTGKLMNWDGLDSVTVSPSTNYRVKLHAKPDTDWNAYSDYLDITTADVVATLLIKKNTKTIISPNPTTGFINIKNNDASSVALYTLTGARVAKYNLESSHTLDLSHLQPGNYIIRAINETNNILSTDKIVKY